MLLPLADGVELLGSFSLGLVNFSNGFGFDVSDSVGFLSPKRPPEGAVMPPNPPVAAAEDFASRAADCEVDVAPSERGKGA